MRASLVASLLLVATGCATREITARTFRVLRVVDGARGVPGAPQTGQLRPSAL